MRYYILYKKFSLDLVEEYSQYFSESNWLDFHIINLNIDDDIQMGSFAIEVIILGVGFRLCYQHTETDFRKEIEERAAEMMRQLHD